MKLMKLKVPARMLYSKTPGPERGRPILPTGTVVQLRDREEGLDFICGECESSFWLRRSEIERFLEDL